MARWETDGQFTTLADRYQGKRFNTPNDAAFKSNGDLTAHMFLCRIAMLTKGMGVE